MVGEDAGTVQIIRVEKVGQTEIPVDITFSGGVCCMSEYGRHNFVHKHHCYDCSLMIAF